MQLAARKAFKTTLRLNNRYFAIAQFEMRARAHPDEARGNSPASSARNAEAGQGMEALRMRGAEAEVAETENKAALNVAKATEAPNERAANCGGLFQ